MDVDSADATLVAVFEFVDTVLMIELTIVVIGFIDIIDVIALVSIVVCVLIVDMTDAPLILVVAVVTDAAVTVVGETSMTKSIDRCIRLVISSSCNQFDRKRILFVDIL